jgi:hypothetical protein
MRIEFDQVALSVDAQRRTMRALVIPYGSIGRHQDGRRWRFAPGSAKFGDAKYVRFNDEHVHSSRLGRAVSAEETADGLVMTFRVYDGPEGDRALAAAAELTKTGFSPEIEFDQMDSQPDPDNPGVVLINMANLTAVGFVKNPAFTDARLISVTASADGGTMTDPTPNPAPAPAPAPVPAPNPDPNPNPTPNPAPTPDTAPTAVTFSADQFAQLMASVSRPAGRPTVDPTRRLPGTATAHVDEPLPYAFSFQGGRHVFEPADHDFSTDLFTMLKQEPGAEDAAKRVNALIKAQFSVARAQSEAFNRAMFADVETADVTAYTVPHRYRPDMWQAQRSYATPLWDMIAAGGTDGTKFDIPKFNSSSGLVGPATEKTEPAGGAFVAELQTITPTQVWGKVEITRQAWRAGGNPALSGILWDQMLREYYEDREAAVATFLNTLTAAADITLTGRPAATPDNDDDQLTVGDFAAAQTDLQFVRGGNRFRAFAVQQDLYRVFARVTDDAGRPLYPMLAPSNANGTTQPLYRTIDIGGTTAVPAWALGAGGQTTAQNSWLFDPAVVLGWASAPERLFWDFGATVQTANIPQLSFVTLGIYGDVALGNTDISGVRQVIFDPSV